MSGKRNGVNGLSDAIDELERFASGKTSDFKDTIERELSDIKKTISDLKPKLDEAKTKVEEKVKEHPLAALGILAFLAFMIGWVLGNSRRD